jgi:hypothetical protein
MKLIFTCMMFFGAIQINASVIGDILNQVTVQKVADTGYLVPGSPGPRRPGYPGRPPSRPGNGRPGYGVQCVAQDRGWEEHSGGHYSCNECLREHGECVETCSTRMTECQVDGADRSGRRISFLGRGDSRWTAEDDAMRACYYNAQNCYVVSCQDRSQTVSNRSCR